MRRAGRWIALLVLVAQFVSLIRIVVRLVRSGGGKKIQTSSVMMPEGQVSVIVPVLNEERRLGPCLDGLIAQGPLVAEILVVDGGSHDGTRAVVEKAIASDPRIRWVDASPVAPDWNGKSWGLQVGYEQLSPSTQWVLTIDADVRPKAGLADALVSHAEREHVQALSVATPQHLADAGDAIVHPSLLATMVVRYGIPGSVIVDPDMVQANGQCFLTGRVALDGVGGFASGQHSLVEDITLGRALVRAGYPVAFVEPSDADSLLHVEMYANWRETWINWTRSLPMRDASSGRSWWLRMADLTFSMGAPIPTLAILALRPQMRQSRLGSRFWQLNLVLIMMRGGVLVGIRRAYRSAPWTYWLSPLLDPLSVAMLWAQSLRRSHRWRGRPIRRGQ